MTTHNQLGPASAPDAYDPPSTVERLEQDAEIAGAAAAGGLRAVEVTAVVLLGLLVCPPLAILTFLVVAPLAVAALVGALLFAVISAPYLLVHHFRGGDRHHLPLLGQRLRHAARAIADLAPHRIVADVRKHHPHR